jgi:hypothetical protein
MGASKGFDSEQEAANSRTARKLVDSRIENKLKSTSKIHLAEMGRFTFVRFAFFGCENPITPGTRIS